MNFWQYLFSFLYARHPETGVRYISKARVYVFASGLCLIAVALLIISILQTPIEYVNTNSDTSE